MPEPGLQRLERAFKGITIGAVKDFRSFDEMRKLDGLTETEEQLHIFVSGRAEEFAVWETVQLDFETVFVDATGQRDSPFDRPHFLYGAKVHTPDPVGIVACVMDWHTNDRNETVGAKVAIGVVGTDVAVSFKADVHVTFQGYGSPSVDFPPDDLLG